MPADTIQQLQAMTMEWTQISAAIEAFGREGARIVSMTISAPGEGVTGPETVPRPAIFAAVPTQHIEYPEQMVEAIKAALQRRKTEIESDLKGMGVDIAKVQAAQPTRAAAPQPRARPAGRR